MFWALLFAHCRTAPRCRLGFASLPARRIRPPRQGVFMPQAAARHAPPDSLARWTHAIDARMDRLLPAPAHTAEGVCGAMRDSLLGPGKRLRPLLLLATGVELGGEPEALLDAACALEMVHAASLTLDDLPCMDNAALRRGRPALHVRHGEDVAVLAAVGLLSGAFRCIADSDRLPAAARAQMVVVLADSAGACGLVRGQFEDLRGQRVDARALETLNELKTGVLFRAALSLAAIATGGQARTVQGLSDCGNQIGLAFQLMDDLQDAQPDSQDLENTDRFNLIDALGPAAAHRRFHRHLRQARLLLTQHLPGDRLVGELLDRIEGHVPPREEASAAVTSGSGRGIRAAPLAQPV
ncbi:MAG: polyprenyl synthetase family protein [Comamonadaceae bacterium]|nr:MAG: polyprenyl synthetase family protein [Comamonadaceae bacterium]